MTRFYLITGCSAGGKSTLLEALSARGYATVPEPGRRIVREELAGDGRALPWVDERAFAWRVAEMARSDLEAMRDTSGPVFFDRGLLDAAVALWHLDDTPLEDTLGPVQVYAQRVFLAPPWPALFSQDAERRHDLAAAQAEYERLKDALHMFGHDVIALPRTSVNKRCDFVLDQVT